MPEINRFRRGDSFEKSRANESLFGASAFAEFLTYMASLREGSRGEEVTAMGGWQWGSGMALPAYGEDNGGGMDSRFRLCGGGFSAEGRGWVPAYARTTEGGMGGGFPLPSSRGTGSPRRGGMGPRIPRGLRGGSGSRREDTEAYRQGGWGWVPAYARTTGGSCLSSWRGEAYRRGDGDGFPHPRGHGRGWIPASVFAGAGSLWGDGDGSPHPRGHGWERGRCRCLGGAIVA